MAVPKPVMLYCAGAFNPVTNKHLRIMELARDALHRTGRYKVIKGIFSPAHEKYAKEGLVSAGHRMQMMKLAVSSNPWLSVDPWEVEQPEWTPTAIALDVLKERQRDGVLSQSLYSCNSQIDSDDRPKTKRKKPNTEEDTDGPTVSSSEFDSAQIILLCGADLLESFAVPDLWAKDHMEKMVRDHGLVVMTRSGSDPDKFIYESDMLSKYSYNITVVHDWIGDHLSSTKVRRAIKRNDSVKYSIPESVLQYILQHKLYNENYKPGYPYPFNG